MAIISLDIGGTKILGALFSKKGNIIDKEKTLSKGEEGLNVFLGQVCHVIDRLLERTDKELKGIGAGVPGTINAEGLVFTPNLPLENFDLKGFLAKRYHVPIVLGNDVNLGTFGEYSEIDIPHHNVVGLFPGTGLGGGIIINSSLYTGSGSAGELGHICVEKNGILCGCGNLGCLEMYASKKGMIHYLKEERQKGRISSLDEDVSKGVLKSSKLKKAYLKEDPLIVEVMERLVEYMGIGVGSIINIFNPDLIILGGGIIESFGKPLVDKIKEHAKHHAMKNLYRETEIRSSKLEDDAVIYGAFHLLKSKKDVV